MGDVAWAFAAQLAGALLGELVYRRAAGIPLEAPLPQAGLFWVVVPAQASAGFAAIAVIVHRKGGRLRRDLGLSVRWRDLTAVPLGVGLQIAFSLALWPFVRLLDADRSAQELVETIRETQRPLTWVGVFLGVVVLQPVVEELLFRGLLLRALLRRVSPTGAVLVSSAAFGAIHLLGTSASLEGLSAVVGLSGLGIVLAVQALRSGALGRPALTHIGFNLLTVVSLLAGS